ncbi:hypothetical protein CL630_03180 [bacterium]|nr:hypothetical protein [bacterium]|tara:strand:- start:214 stop:720 length:507 start_codon:yes stop_codon:yes gene_type:complete
MTEVDIELQENIDDKEPRLYELGYHLLPTLSEEEIPQEVGVLKDGIEKHSGAMVSDQMPRVMSLAYSMSKIMGQKRKYFDTALFGWIKFQMSPKDLLEFDKELKHNKHILRFILVKIAREKLPSVKKMTFLKPKQPTGRITKEQKVQKPGKQLSEEELDKTIEELVGN